MSANEKSACPQGKYIFIWGQLLKKAGGMTRAMLSRANLLIQQGCDVKILLCSRGKEQLDAIDYWSCIGFSEINEDNFITEENVLERYCCSFAPNKLKLKNILGKIGKNYHFLPRKDGAEGDGEYYKKGYLKYSISTRADLNNKLKIITKYNKDESAKDQKFYYKNTLSRQIDYLGKSLKKTLFYGQNGWVYLTIKEREINNVWNIEEITLYRELTGDILKFNSLIDLHRFVIKIYVNQVTNTDKIFLFHDPLLDFNPGFDAITNHKVIKIGIVHGCGIGGERQWWSQINPRLQQMIESKITPDIDALCCLTNEQIQDFEKRLGKRNIYYYLPNIIHSEHVHDFKLRDNYKIVSICRLSKEKRLTDLLKAWPLVKAQFPKAHLHIYGDGQERENLSIYIKSNNLQSVYIEGFTDNVSDVYQDSICSVSTSISEAFNISLCESLANGTPVITYNYKYGPKDIVTDGYNGFIVENANVKDLAKKICRFLSLSTDEKKSISTNAMESVRRFTADNHLRRLQELLKSTLKNKEKEVCVKAVSATLLKECQSIYLTIKFILNSKSDFNLTGHPSFGIKVYAKDNKSFTEVDKEASFIAPLTYRILLSINDVNNNTAIYTSWNSCYWEKRLSEIEMLNK